MLLTRVRFPSPAPFLYTQPVLQDFPIWQGLALHESYPNGWDGPGTTFLDETGIQ